jgi:ketosteroid isomerase-like protein
MKKQIGLLLAVMAASLFTLHSAEQKDAYTARDENDVRQLETQWAKAIEEGDTAAMERILASDYTGVDPAGKVLTKTQELDMYSKGDLKIQSIQTGEQKIKIYIGGAIVTGASTVKGKYKGEDVSGEYRYIDYLERRKDGWQVVYSQLTKVETDEDKKEKKAEKPKK